MIGNLDILKFLWILVLTGLTAFMLMRLYLLRWWKCRPKMEINKQDFKVKVIVPCKGADVELSENLKSLKNQNYKNFSIVAVVDSENDEACDFIRENKLNMLLSRHQWKGSGKVKAISTAIAEDRDSDIFVVVDSDTRVNSHWLENLIYPLSDEAVGVVSTYPVYESVDKPGIWDHIKKVWGYVGINMMEFRPTRFAWGGSVAFRKNFLNPGDFEEFSSSISDDATLTKLCKEKSLKIAYAKDSTPVVYSKESRETFMEWSNRQIAITLSYSKSAFYAALIVYGLTIFYLGVLIPLSLLVWNMFLMGYIPFILLILLNMLREKNRSLKIVVATFLIPVIFMINIIHGRRNPEINWRGNTYNLDEDKI